MMVFKRLKRLFHKDDPLLKLAYKEYDFNLLSIPREKAAVGDIYLYDGNSYNRLKPFGYISSFIRGVFPTPKTKTEGLGDISETISDEASSNIGLKFLEAFLSLLTGAPAFGTTIGAQFKTNRITNIRFQFTKGTREYVDPSFFANEIQGYQVNLGSALYNRKYHYFIVTAVLRSSSVRVISDTSKEKTTKIGAKAELLAKGKGGLTVNYSEKGKIVFDGEKPLAFGVQLYEIEYDFQSERFSMKPTDRAYNTLKDEVKKKAMTYLPSFIGNPKRNDVFVEITDQRKPKRKTEKKKTKKRSSL
jgi:hypothetical protein